MCGSTCNHTSRPWMDKVCSVPNAGMWLHAICFTKDPAARRKPRRRQYGMAEQTGCRVSVPPP